VDMNPGDSASEAEIAKLTAGCAYLTFKLISGADHVYLEHRPQLWDVVSRWLDALV